VAAVVTAAVLLVITGALAISDLGVLDPGAVSDAVPSASPSASPSEAPSRSRGPSVTPGPIPARTELPVTAPPEVDQGSPYTCEDREIRAASRSRWQLRGVLAGSRRGFERVTLELMRLGRANRPARIMIEWMSPEEARDTFGLPRFDGQRGILVTFGGQVSTPATQLIGPVDLRGGGMESISGVYRFLDVEGQVRTFIAIRDESCARVRAPELVDADRASRRATILVDLAGP
jgi:hypothetical protein